MATQDENLAYFEQQLGSNDEFFARFGAEPVWTSARVLDLGCGHGAMSVRAAAAGAAHVVGIDLDVERVQFARAHVNNCYPELTHRLEFSTLNVAELAGEFDLIMTKDTLEHVEHLDTMLRMLADRLAPNGELWAGFSPLYCSPWGDHRRTGVKLPWAHTLLPWSVVRRFASRKRGVRVATLADVGLNGATPSAYRQAFRNAGLAGPIAYNRGEKPLLRILDRVRRVPGLEPYTTVSIYARLSPRGTATVADGLVPVAGSLRT